MLKKIFAGLIIGAVAVSLVLPLVVSAQAAPPQLPTGCTVRADVESRLKVVGCGDKGTPCVYSDETDCGICCLLGTILYVTDWIFLALIIIVILLVLFGAFNIMTSAGSTEKVDSGRNQIMFAAIGFGVSLLARAVPAIVRFLIATQ